ncbi:hypothetical protein [Halorussus salinus]|uniref:hypothetical protein n=1 Tax=Halorussus salinus TaxID=1364935 RepID=UPI00109254D0|nr:hypothetical protein [Halorussus salinus]
MSRRITWCVSTNPTLNPSNPKMNGKTFGLLVGIAALSLVAVGSAAALSSGNCGMDACYDNDALSESSPTADSITTAPEYIMCDGVGCYDVDSITTTPEYIMCGGVGCYDVD